MSVLQTPRSRKPPVCTHVHRVTVVLQERRALSNLELQKKQTLIQTKCFLPAITSPSCPNTSVSLLLQSRKGLVVWTGIILSPGLPLHPMNWNERGEGESEEPKLFCAQIIVHSVRCLRLQKCGNEN